MAELKGIFELEAQSPYFLAIAKDIAPKYTNNPNTTILAFDPGYTTGVAVLRHGSLIAYGQIDTTILNQGLFKRIADIIDTYLGRPAYASNVYRLVIEDYKVYSWKGEEHEWSSLHTPKLIGFIQAVCAVRDIEPKMRMAMQAKAFTTDDKLKKFGWYLPNARHARDAIRHAVYEALFTGTPNPVSKPKSGRSVG